MARRTRLMDPVVADIMVDRLDRDDTVRDGIFLDTPDR